MVVRACFRVVLMVTAWRGHVCPSEAIEAVLSRSSFYAYTYMRYRAIVAYTQFSIRSLVAVGRSQLVIILIMCTASVRLFWHFGSIIYTRVCVGVGGELSE